METVTCRFFDCCWVGGVCDLLEHCENDHTRFVRYNNQTNGFKFDLIDILENAFLLSCEDLGLFWFLLDHGECRDATIRRGLFSVKSGDAVQYTARIGQIGDDTLTYLGPYSTDSENYDVEYSFEAKSLDFTSEVMEVCFGEFNECDHHSDLSEESFSGTLSDEEYESEEGFSYLNNYCSDCIACFGENFDQGGCALCTGDVRSNDAPPTEKVVPEVEEIVWKLDDGEDTTEAENNDNEILERSLDLSRNVEEEVECPENMPTELRSFEGLSLLDNTAFEVDASETVVNEELKESISATCPTVNDELIEEIHRPEEEAVAADYLNSVTVVETDFIIFCELDVDDVSLIESLQTEIMVTEEGISNFLETMLMTNGSFSCVYTEVPINQTEEDSGNQQL